MLGGGDADGSAVGGWQPARQQAKIGSWPRVGCRMGGLRPGLAAVYSGDAGLSRRDARTRAWACHHSWSGRWHRAEGCAASEEPLVRRLLGVLNSKTAIWDSCDRHCSREGKCRGSRKRKLFPSITLAVVKPPYFTHSNVLMPPQQCYLRRSFPLAAPCFAALRKSSARCTIKPIETLLVPHYRVNCTAPLWIGNGIGNAFTFSTSDAFTAPAP